MGKIKIIVAAANNHTIGNDNDLPWHLPTDLKRFKEITMGSTIIMGRKCWDSIPLKFRPLPGRLNVVLTRTTSNLPNSEGPFPQMYLSSMEEILELSKNDDVFIIGGAEVYKQCFPMADEVYLTRLQEDVEGNIKLTGFNPDEWDMVSKSELIEENGYSYHFELYKKNKPLTYKELVEIFSKY